MFAGFGHFSGGASCFCVEWVTLEVLVEMPMLCKAANIAARGTVIRVVVIRIGRFRSMLMVFLDVSRPVQPRGGRTRVATCGAPHVGDLHLACWQCQRGAQAALQVAPSHLMEEMEMGGNGAESPVKLRQLRVMKKA